MRNAARLILGSSEEEAKPDLENRLRLVDADQPGAAGSGNLLGSGEEKARVPEPDYFEAVHRLMLAARENAVPGQAYAAIEHALDALRCAVGARGAALLGHEVEEGELAYGLGCGQSEVDVMAHARVPVNNSIAGWVLDKGYAAVVNDVANDPRQGHDAGRRARRLIAVPVRSRHKLVGVLEVVDKIDDMLFTTADLTRAEIMSTYIGRVVSRLDASPGA